MFVGWIFDYFVKIKVRSIWCKCKSRGRFCDFCRYGLGSRFLGGWILLKFLNIVEWRVFTVVYRTVVVIVNVRRDLGVCEWGAGGMRLVFFVMECYVGVKVSKVMWWALMWKGFLGDCYVVKSKVGAYMVIFIYKNGGLNWLDIYGKFRKNNRYF